MPLDSTFGGGGAGDDGKYDWAVVYVDFSTATATATHRHTLFTSVIHAFAVEDALFVATVDLVCVAV